MTMIRDCNEKYLLGSLESFEQFMERFEEAPICQDPIEFPYTPGNDFSTVCGLEVYAGTADFLREVIASRGDFTSRTACCPLFRQVIVREIGVMITNMHFIQAHDLSLPILLHWRDLCRDSMAMSFDLQFLMDHVRRLASLYYVQQHQKERVLALEALVRERSEQR